MGRDRHATCAAVAPDGVAVIAGMDRHPFLTVLGAEIVTAALVVVGWNIAQHYQDRGVTLRAGIRASLRL